MSASGLAPGCANLKSRLLEGLALHDVKVILAAARQSHFPAHSVIVNQGDPADHLFLLTKGRARFFFDTSEGEKVVLMWLTTGDIFGGAALLSVPSPYLVSAETLKDSSLLIWDRTTMRKLVAVYPRLLENALLIGLDYLNWYLADHVSLISKTARQRLARVLIYLAKSIGTKGTDGFEIDATNEELANAANISPFTASRLLSDWESSSAVVKRRGKILLRYPERLFLHPVNSSKNNSSLPS